MNDDSLELQVRAVCQRLERLRRQVADGALSTVAKAGLDALETGLEEIQGVLEALTLPVARPGGRAADTAARLRDSALEAAANAIVITDRQGIIRWANPAYSRLTGYAPEQALGKPLNALKSGQHDDASHRNLWETILGGQAWRGEFVNRRPDGSRFNEETTITPIRDTTGEITHFIAIQQDITERKLAELALTAANDRLQTLFQASPLPIIVLDPQGLVRMWNAAAERTFGWSAAEVEGHEPPFVPPEGRDDHHLWTASVLGGETLHGGDLKRCQKKDGTTLEFLLSAAPVHGPDGAVDGLAALYLDITEKANLEAQLLRAQRLESIGHLAGGIAHDLNNILSPMMMAAPLLRDEIKTPTGQAMLKAVENSAKRGSDIVKQVLGFARGLKADKVPVQTRHLLRETVEIMQQTFPKSIHIKFSFPRELWLVEGNGTHLHQVLMNLCINARDAMPDGGILTLLAENFDVPAALAGQTPNAHPSPHVVWTVTDTGTGIAPEHLGRLFDPFFTTKPVGGGSGLGLHTVATILRHHGGFIQVQSQVGQGSTFKVFLPALPGAQAAEPPSAAALPRRRDECILVVDDEDNIRTLLRAVLERHGYHVLLAGSGPEALALWPHHPEIQLVIMDLMMPGMSGVELIKTLRELSPKMKVVVNTGVTDANLLAELAPLQVDAMLSKPAETAHLLATLEKTLAAKPNPL